MTGHGLGRPAAAQDPRHRSLAETAHVRRRAGRDGGAAGLGLSDAAAVSGRPPSTAAKTIRSASSARWTPRRRLRHANPFVLNKCGRAFAGPDTAGRRSQVEIVTATASPAIRGGPGRPAAHHRRTHRHQCSPLRPGDGNPCLGPVRGRDVPCIGTIVPGSGFLGRGGGRSARPARESNTFKYTYLYFLGLEDELAGRARLQMTRPTAGRRPVAQRRRRPGIPRCVHQVAAKEGVTVFDRGPDPDGTPTHPRSSTSSRADNCEDRIRLPTAPDFLTFGNSATR